MARQQSLQAASQPSLFAFDFSRNAIQPGDIVRQAWDWILCNRGEEIMPYWQVHHMYLDSVGERIYMCRPVPFTMGDGNLHGFKEHDLERTGLSWRVPDYDEVKEWFVDLGTTQFLAMIGSNKLTVEQAHPAERELVDLLLPLGPLRLQRAAFYDHFPYLTFQERGGRL